MEEISAHDLTMMDAVLQSCSFYIINNSVNFSSNKIIKLISLQLKFFGFDDGAGFPFSLIST
ncbi:MAG: hypothetical protein ABIQ31_01875 [Ferruginibacter sp.]